MSLKLSIITVTKNNKPGLLRAIDCVRNQTYRNVEHIIVDGGSADGTVDILRSEQKEINSRPVIPANEVSQESTLDSGLRRNDTSSNNAKLPATNYSLLAISEPDNGIYDAINKGIKLATGDVIGLLHSDDLYADENMLERIAEVFKSRAEGKEQSAVEAVYSDLVYVRKKSDSGQVRQDFVQPGRVGMTEPRTSHYSRLTTSYSVIRYWKTHKSVKSNQSLVNRKDTDHHLLVTDHLLKNGWMPPHPTLFVRKEIFDKYGFYNTYLKIASDYDMILRLLFKHKITSYYLPITTYLMSIGGASNKSIKNIIQKSKEDYLAMKMNGIKYPVITLFSKNFRKLPQFLARDL